MSQYPEPAEGLEEIKAVQNGMFAAGCFLAPVGEIDRARRPFAGQNDEASTARTERRPGCSASVHN
jgi:hypothetical protein